MSLECPGLYLCPPKGEIEAGYLDMLAEADKVKALAVAGQLVQLPGKAYARNKESIRKATLDRIRASLGAHHKV